MPETAIVPQELPDLFAYAKKQYELLPVATAFDSWLKSMETNDENKILKFPDWHKRIKGFTKPIKKQVPEIASILSLVDAFADELSIANEYTLYPYITLSNTASTMSTIVHRGRVLFRSVPNVFEGYHIPIQIIRIPYIDNAKRPVGSYLTGLIVEPDFNGTLTDPYHEALAEIALWDGFYTSEQLPSSLPSYRNDQPNLSRLLGTNNYEYLPFPPLI